MNAICKSSPCCPSYQRRPNKPVNAMLAYDFKGKISFLSKILPTENLVTKRAHGTYRLTVRGALSALILMTIVNVSMYLMCIYGLTKKKEKGTRGLRSWHLHIAFPVLYEIYKTGP